MATPSSAAPAPWRQFPFFEPVPIKDVNDLDSPPVVFKVRGFTLSVLQALTIRRPPMNYIHGSVHALNQDFESYMSWVAHTSGRVTHMVERKGVLVTLGEEDFVRYPLLKIWDLQNTDKRTGAPILLRSTKVNVGNRMHPISTVVLTASLSHLAIGLGDGTVLLYRHLDQSLASSASLTSVPKPKTVHESPAEPVTGLGFAEPTDEHPQTHLFVATTNRVLAYQVSGRGSGGPATVVNEIGCGLGCTTMDRAARDLVIARDEAIYVCGTEGRGSSYALEGRKLSLGAHGGYLVIVSPPFSPSASAPSATVRNFYARNAATGETDVTKVTLFDAENKVVGFSQAFPQGVREVFSAWGNVYVLGNDGSVTHLEEKSTSEKLDMLYRRGYYPLALGIAKTQQLDDASIADIHLKTADALYNKKNYDDALTHYVQTIGHVQPSYVIRKLLDAQRIHNLVTYLQELHSHGLANADHTTLLLNTYTKLKDVARLDSFIKTESRRNAEDSDELPFDLETAIRVCRQAGYFEHASYLAKKYNRHEDYLRIQVEDATNYKEALQYLRKLGADAAESNLARYGRALLANLPDETTKLLIDLCTGIDTRLDDTEENSPSSIKAPAPSYLSYLALKRDSVLPPSPESTVAPTPSVKTARPGDSFSRQGSYHGRSQSQASTRTSTPPPAPPKPSLPPSVKRISPRLYFAHFVDHMEQFVVFLETVALRRWGQTVDPDQQPPSLSPEPPADEQADHRDQVAVWNTLLELYLTLSGTGVGVTSEGTGSSERQQALRDKALRLLKSETIPYDSTHALILCSSRGYTEGLVLLWERAGMYEDVLRFWMDRDAMDAPGASTEVVRCLQQYGPAHPHLYPLVLRFLTSAPALLSRHEADVRDIIERIDAEGVLPPLGVVQILSRNGVASVGLVKEWLMGKIRDARGEIETDKEWINSYRLETATKLRQVDDLSDPEHPQIFHVTTRRCTQCSGQLDLPSVHFMCNHSYHQRCLPENETECPACAREHGVIREIRRNNERLADQHDVFLSEVVEGGFDAIASGFSRGVLNMPRVNEAVAS
ncbi:hypothetical protein GGG16DRAFT_63250 [Schizophyllum commune]